MLGVRDGCLTRKRRSEDDDVLLLMGSGCSEAGQDGREYMVPDYSHEGNAGAIPDSSLPFTLTPRKQALEQAPFAAGSTGKVLLLAAAQVQL
ncbi:hypothetical protein UY3_08189 [Chelonia mydas]|uniref:Uncharacterized protein n=1 Tax=Chelonia mydas TaxID=8469 RepID=M7BR87_CHEMY|nr:hypothetical protein UY3_08189 [Chelonia mydas]